eukprot:TRINITY_DN25048_c0_g1_i1.p1 TRINITY_DN25048_c0_g1~~TRINITY_DN25048_c0_g1_i1.p1  ORF type:complete len:709 (+),score=141.92 TRINITY_DN25048_c0_g1_i1:115-2241(+)
MGKVSLCEREWFPEGCQFVKFSPVPRGLGSSLRGGCSTSRPLLEVAFGTTADAGSSSSASRSRCQGRAGSSPRGKTAGSSGGAAPNVHMTGVGPLNPAPPLLPAMCSPAVHAAAIATPPSPELERGAGAAESAAVVLADSRGSADGAKAEPSSGASRGGPPAASPEALKRNALPSWPALPYDVAETLTQSVWRFARQLALKASEAGSQSEPSSPSSAPKRLRSTTSHSSVDDFALNDVGSQPTQPTQSAALEQEQLDEGSSTLGAEAVAHARSALADALTQAHGVESCEGLESTVQGMALIAFSYWREVSRDLSKATSALARFLEFQRRLYWRKASWCGVNLGGWLLLEPGPSSSIFQKYGPDATCEWDLLRKMKETLGDEKTQEALREHRDTFITEEDIRQIAALGLNAVRIPFGYWAITGPSNGDPYDGPLLEYLDRALDWCKTHGLQVLLDLHGAPGGESGEKPCGRERSDWRWQDWRQDESVQTLRVLAERYRGHPAVSGVAVCNEPSETIPAEALCHFYDRAVTAVREGGMRPDEVAVTLPVYRTERLDAIWRLWNRKYDGFARHANVAFDLHLYHCFGPWWQRQSMPQHMRMTRRHRKILRRVPAVVGEWSLALPPYARRTRSFSSSSVTSTTSSSSSLDDDDQATAAFGEGQLDAYSQASHGWFFWNWKDRPDADHAVWDLQRCVERQWFKKEQFEKRSPA